MSAPEAVTLWGVASTMKSRLGSYDSAYPERIMAECQACNYAEDRKVVELRVLPAAQYAALVAERDALRDALTDLIDAASHVPVDREWSPLLTSSLTCARAALGAERA